MKIQTLKEDLKIKADYANTATQVTNRIVKECMEMALDGIYTNVVYIELEVKDAVLANLQNEFTDLGVEENEGNWCTISWED